MPRQLMRENTTEDLEEMWAFFVLKSELEKEAYEKERLRAAGVKVD